MIALKPITPTTTQLTASSIVEPAAGEVVWASGSSYSVGDEVIDTTTHRKYRSLIDSNQNNNPQNEEYDLNGRGTNWVIVGSSLRYSMFDSKTSTQSISSTPFTFTLTPNENVTALAAFNVTGATAINVTMVDGSETVYNKDIEMRDDGVVDDWFDYFFEPIIVVDRFILLDLPAFPNASITITTTGEAGSEIGLGEFVYGTQVTIGVAQTGTSSQLLDFSVRERNFDGSFTINRRRTADLFDYDFSFETRRFSYIRNQVKSISTMPTVFIGNPSDINDPLAIFGYYKDFQINYETPDGISFGSLQVEEII